MTREEEIREIDEAIYAGREAYNAICEAESHLSGARGMGIWDLLGGGLISGVLKHSEMDKAQQCVDRANMAMQRFQKELRDLNMSINYGVEFDTLAKVVDIVFDNFLVDALIQSRIKETQRNLQSTKQQVQMSLQELQRMRDAR